MLRFSLLAFAGLLMCLPLSGQNALEDLIQEKIDQMSHLQKMNQIRRNSFWTTSDNEVLGIPGFVMSDGPHGVRFVDATSFPTGIAMAASWNKDMMFDIGRAMAGISRLRQTPATRSRFGFVPRSAQRTQP